jgi:cell division topological specificity factor MinE
LEVEHGLTRIFPPFPAHRERRQGALAHHRRPGTRRARRADYLPTLRRELLEVIRKYINIDPEAVQINLEQEDGQELLEFTVALPHQKGESSAS